MVRLDFDGWFQCRLATDPDAFDDPRGQQGWTFALPGEPDLDRVIRFSAPVTPRSRGPEVGVAIRAVAIDGTLQPSHPLLGSAVELSDAPVFEGRNGLIAPSASEPIVPFTLRVAGGEIVLVGRDPIDLAVPSEIARRQPIDFEGNSAEAKAATGIVNPAAFRQQRKAQLLSDLAVEIDPVNAAVFKKRIDELGKASIRLTSLGFKLTFRFDLRGPNEWTDPGGALGPTPASDAAWMTAFWMGGWDADTLCGFIRGSLRVG